MTHQFKYDLGIDLYEEVIDLVSNNDRQAYIDFNHNNLQQIERVFTKYRDSDVSVQLLYLFLSSHSKYTGRPRIFSLKNRLVDITESFGYTQLVAEKYLKDPVL